MIRLFYVCVMLIFICSCGASTESASANAQTNIQADSETSMQTDSELSLPVCSATKKNIPFDMITTRSIDVEIEPLHGDISIGRNDVIYVSDSLFFGNDSFSISSIDSMTNEKSLLKVSVLVRKCNFTINLSWDRVEDVEVVGYQVYELSEGRYSKIANLGNVNSHVIRVEGLGKHEFAIETVTSNEISPRAYTSIYIQ